MGQLSARQSEKIRYHLEHIMEQLPGAVITIVARNPMQMPGMDDTIITADDLEKVIASLEFQNDIQIQAELDKYRVKN